MTQLYNVIRAVCGRVETYRATTGLHYLGNMDFLFPPTLSWLGSDVAFSCGCIQSGTTKIIYQQDEPLNSKIKNPAHGSGLQAWALWFYMIELQLKDICVKCVEM